MSSFWMVWSPSGLTPPRVRHSTRPEALRVADDMAKKHEREFYVMQATDQFLPPGHVHHNVLDDRVLDTYGDDDLPF